MPVSVHAAVRITPRGAMTSRVAVVLRSPVAAASARRSSARRHVDAHGAVQGAPTIQASSPSPAPVSRAFRRRHNGGSTLLTHGGPPDRRAAEEVGVRCGAAASSVPSLSDARGGADRGCRPLADAIGEGPTAVSEGPLVFAMLQDDDAGGDGGAEASTVVYVGVAKKGRAAVREQAAALGLGDGVRVACAELPKASRRPQLQAAWKAWLVEVGYVPAGNNAQASQQQQQRTADDADADSAREAALEVAMSVVSEEAVKALCEDGFVIIDDVLPAQTLAAAHAAAERLHADGKMMNVGQEGRDDDIAVLDAKNLPGRQLPQGRTSPYAGVTVAAELLLAIPAALRARAAAAEAVYAPSSDAQADDVPGAPTKSWSVVTEAPAAVVRNSAAAATSSRLATSVAPERLMLAYYPGSGARYVRHIDNDPEDPDHNEGEPGLRACDRSVTAILYLNPDWEEAHGGCLRIELEDGRGELDVAPAAGRLVLFDCRRMAHEVLPSFSGRWAMTAWING